MHLTLYVMGGSHRSARAVRNLRRLIGQLGLEVELEVVDLIVNPERGEADRVLATPTLIRRAPGPELRIIGDLSVADVVTRIFDAA